MTVSSGAGFDPRKEPAVSTGPHPTPAVAGQGNHQRTDNPGPSNPVSLVDHPLPPYNPDAVCPKCGHDNVSTWYQEPCSCDDGSFCEAEALIRTCQRCRFQWGEAAIKKRRTTS